MRYYETLENRASYRWDLGARTDGQPDYSGVFENPPQNLTTNLEDLEGWLLKKFVYQTVGTEDVAVTIYYGVGSWTNRATATYR